MIKSYLILLATAGSVLLGGCASWFEDSVPGDQSTTVQTNGQKSTAPRPRYAGAIARQGADDAPIEKQDTAKAADMTQPVAPSPAPAANPPEPSVPDRSSATPATVSAPSLGPRLEPMTVVTSIEQNQALASMPVRPTGAETYPTATDGTDTVTVSGLGVDHRSLRAMDRGEQIATIRFAVGSDRLSREARRILDQVVKLHKQRGGWLRVVGHASSRTADGTMEHHIKVNEAISDRRARAVAKELIRRGAAQNRVEAVAVSNREPIYYEFMPSGEAGNRRAEIYLVSGIGNLRANFC